MTDFSLQLSNKLKLSNELNPFVTKDEETLKQLLSDTKKRSSINPIQRNRIHKCITGFETYIDSLDKGLVKYLLKKEDSYINTYKEMVNSKTRELDEVNKRMNDRYLRILHDEEVSNNKAEISSLKGQLNNLTNYCESAEGNYKKIKGEIENLKEENKLLRVQLKRKYNEDGNLKIFVKYISEELNQAEIRIQHTISMENKCNELTKFITKLKQNINEFESQVKNPLELALKSIEYSISKPTLTPKRLNKIEVSVESKRSFSNVRGNSNNLYKRYIENLIAKNESLEKQLNALKAKMGSIIYQKRNLEEIFTDSINATKKEIYKRKFGVNTSKNINFNLIRQRLKSSITNDVTSTVKNIKNCLDDNKNINYKDFTSEDKLNLVTLFVCNDKIVKHIFDLLFPKRESLFISQLRNNLVVSSQETNTITQKRRSYLSNVNKEMEV